MKTRGQIINDAVSDLERAGFTSDDPNALKLMILVLKIVYEEGGRAALREELPFRPGVRHES